MMERTKAVTVKIGKKEYQENIRDIKKVTFASLVRVVSKRKNGLE